jgi:predicted RNase H-like HicB family nuclease
VTQTYTVVLHLEAGSEDSRDVLWWADSPEIDGWTAGAKTLSELTTIAEEGIRFYLDTEVLTLTYVMERQPSLSEGPKELKKVNDSSAEIPQSRGVDASTLVTT